MYGELKIGGENKGPVNVTTIPNEEGQPVIVFTQPEETKATGGEKGDARGKPNSGFPLEILSLENPGVSFLSGSTEITGFSPVTPDDGNLYRRMTVEVVHAGTPPASPENGGKEDTHGK